MAAYAIFASSILTGAFVHLCYFRSNEHHLYPFRYVQFHGLLFVIAVALLPLLAGIPVGQSLKAISQAMLCYLGGLYASLTLYRCILHPVNAFPGPIGAKLSALWLSWQLRSRPAFRMLHDLHCKYGPIVRIGPSDLSIVDPQAVRLIYGQQSSCTKNEFYDMSYPAQSLLSFREKPLHDRRRRVWSTGFSDKALRGYERRIQVYRQKLFDQFMVREGELVNVIKWFSFYAYDVMGDLAFARSFDMLDDNQNHWAIQVLLDGIGPLEYMIPVWLLRLCLGIAVLSKDWWRFGQFCNDRLMHRMKVDQHKLLASSERVRVDSLF
jgi:tryprostatin B 6-hydroxylase